MRPPNGAFIQPDSKYRVSAPRSLRYWIPDLVILLQFAIVICFVDAHTASPSSVRELQAWKDSREIFLKCARSLKRKELKVFQRRKYLPINRAACTVSQFARMRSFIPANELASTINLIRERSWRLLGNLDGTRLRP